MDALDEDWEPSSSSSCGDKEKPVQNVDHEESEFVLKPHLCFWTPGEKALSFRDDLYDAQADAEDEEYVQRRFGKTDTVLSCPGCFTPVCYQSEQDSRDPTRFFATSYVNCKVVRSDCQFATETGDTMSLPNGAQAPACKRRAVSLFGSEGKRPFSVKLGDCHDRRNASDGSASYSRGGEGEIREGSFLIDLSNQRSSSTNTATRGGKGVICAACGVLVGSQLEEGRRLVDFFQVLPGAL